MEQTQTRTVTETYDPTCLLHWAKWQQAGRPDLAVWNPEVIQTLVDGDWIDEPPPTVVTTWADYDPSDDLHLYQWLMAGEPDPSQLDGDGNSWRPTLNYRLVGDAYQLPQVHLAEAQFRKLLLQLESKESERKNLIDRLRTEAALAIYAHNKDYSATMAAGAQFGGRYAADIYSFERFASGNLRERLVHADEAWLSWSTAPGKTIRDIFLDGLPVGPVSAPTPILPQVQRDAIAADLSGVLSLVKAKSAIDRLTDWLAGEA